MVSAQEVLEGFEWSKDGCVVEPAPIIHSRMFSFLNGLEGKVLGKDELYEGRIVGYLSAGGDPRYVQIVGWEDYRREYILLKPLGPSHGRTLIKRRVTSTTRWLVPE